TAPPHDKLLPHAAASIMTSPPKPRPLVRAVAAILWLLMLLLLVEGSSRAFWRIRYRVSFVNTRGNAQSFYPELVDVLAARQPPRRHLLQSPRPRSRPIRPSHRLRRFQRGARQQRPARPLPRRLLPLLLVRADRGCAGATPSLAVRDPLHSRLPRAYAPGQYRETCGSSAARAEGSPRLVLDRVRP